MKKFWRKVRHAAEALLDKLWDSLIEEYDYPPPEPEPEHEEAPAPAPEPEPEPEVAPGEQSPGPMNWRHGGFNGAGALEDEENKLLSVSANRDGVRFKFSGTSWWGATRTAIHELRKRIEKVETTLYTGNGKPSLLERFAALERAQATQTWLLRLIVGGVLTNTIGLAFIIMRKGL